MIQVGDRVVYGVQGVCDVVECETRTVNKKQVIYLVLEPLGQPGSRYLVPSQNEAALAKLKKLLTRKELEDLIHSDLIRKDHWIQDEGQRKQAYRELITGSDRQKLMGMVHSLYRHREKQMEQGRKMHICDENFLRDAEKLLAGEISVVMNLDADQARQYIRTNLC